MAALAPEIITSLNGFPITNTLVTTILIDAILLGLLVFLTTHLKMIPGKIQSMAEMLFGYFYDMAQSMAGSRARAIFPWVMTFFLFILISNFLGLLPGVGSIGFNETAEHTLVVEEDKVQEDLENTSENDIAKFNEGADRYEETNIPSTPPTENKTSESRQESSKEKHHLIPLLRPATSDFNATFALAAISLLATHALSIKYTGLKDYLKRFFSLNPILLFVGLLELVSEFIKIFSLSFRLFGNIYAGEVVLATISGLFAFLAPLPFLLLETIVAVVQALVFAMLTLVFMSMLTEKHHDASHG